MILCVRQSAVRQSIDVWRPLVNAKKSRDPFLK